MLSLIKKIRLPTLSKRYINSNYLKIIIALFIIYFVIQLLRKHKPINEGFSGLNQREKLVTKKKVDDIYDEFYNSIYDDLVYDDNKNKFELTEIIRSTKMKPSKSMVLDIGCGNGHHVNLLTEKGIKSIGLDISPNMVERANMLYPKINVKQGDVLKEDLFNNNTFSHILSLYFTAYYIKDKQQYFDNCYKWLKPGGYLALHLVNRDMFNPIVSAGDPFVMISPQKHARERITKTVVKFKDFKYKSRFNLDRENNKAYFEESFKEDNTNKVRQNIHEFYMEPQSNIIEKAKTSGFNLLGKIDLVNIKYEYQYIYILQK
jgi:SAM-dependent methyltransferase